MLLISVSLSVNVAVAEEAIVLNQGQPAPYTGLLLDQNKANELYTDLNNYKLLNNSLEKSVKLYLDNEDLYNKKINMLLEQNNKLADNLNKVRSSSDWEKVLWFGLGFFSVGLGIYGVKAVTK